MLQELSISKTRGSSCKKHPPPFVASSFSVCSLRPRSLFSRCCDCTALPYAAGQQHAAGAFCRQVTPRRPNVGSARTSDCLCTAPGLRLHGATNVYRRCSLTASGEHREALFCSRPLTFCTGVHPRFKCWQCLYQTCSFVCN